MKTVTTTVDGSLKNEATKTKPKHQGWFSGLKTFFGEIWEEMNRELTEEEKKEYDLFLKNRPYNPYDPFNPYSGSGFNSFF